MPAVETQSNGKPRRAQHPVPPPAGVIPIRPGARPTNMVDVSIPSGQHTLRVTVYRGKASRLVKAGPGERIYNAGRGLVLVLDFPFAEGGKGGTESTGRV